MTYSKKGSEKRIYIQAKLYTPLCHKRRVTRGFTASKIKDAIFGKKAVAATPVGAPVTTAPVEAAPVAMTDVDVIAHLEEIDANDGRNLNWRSSIVDLMKMVGMESSLQERKDLAMELGYTGELEGSAEMNIWLHKAVMRELAANGGVVPAELLD
jgi:hypothetical protein